MKILLSLLFLLSSVSFLTAQTGPYALIRFQLPEEMTLDDLLAEDIGIDHFHTHANGAIELELTYQELDKLEYLGINYDLIKADAEAHFADLLNASTLQLTTTDCGLDNYDIGTMGGYHTFDEVVTHLTNMEAMYPSLVDVFSAGTSYEGRTIWAIKISDNVADDESGSEGVVYYDALTHAREPLSMETQLYYFWWLLENYGTDPEATYLVDNREIYAILVVNPDGYVYNQTTNPGGGGLWRKNRRPDPDSGCFGVDLNRNYGYQWGLEPGSSGDPCSNIYRGEAPFSEPESATVRDLVLEIQPAIAFTNHTHGQTFLSPFGYADTLAEYDLYAEFVSEFIPQQWDGYGTTAKMLGYTSSGTTRDYLHSEGIPAWTPEIGNSFWEIPDVLCSRLVEYLIPMKYLSWVSGNYACYHDFATTNQHNWRGDTLSIFVRIKNRGLSFPSENVMVTLTSIDGLTSPLEDNQNYGDIPTRSFQTNTDPFLFVINESVELLDKMALQVQVEQNGALSYTDTIYITAGAKTILLQEDGSSTSNWQADGNGIPWSANTMDFTSGLEGLGDSELNNYAPNTTNNYTLLTPVDLTNATNPVLHFHTKWSLEPLFDFVELQYSTNGGSFWNTLQSEYNTPFGYYTGNKHWIQDRVDLSDFVGQQIQFRFRLESDNSIHSDGFYFDDFSVVDYSVPVMSNAADIDASKVELQIMPNPSGGICRLHLASTAPQSVHWLLYDLPGRLLHSGHFEMENNSHFEALDLSDLAKGIYLFEIQLGTTRLHRRLVIE